jgi:hypothetical protein
MEPATPILARVCGSARYTHLKSEGPVEELCVVAAVHASEVMIVFV